MVFNKKLSLCWSLINDDLFHLRLGKCYIWMTFKQLNNDIFLTFIILLLRHSLVTQLRLT